MIQKKELPNNEVVLEITESLDATQQRALGEYFAEVEKGPYRTVTLNLERVEAINSACLGKILLHQKRLTEKGRRFMIRGCSDSLYKTFWLIRLTDVVDIEKDLA